jgi:hypothetical protein
MTSLGVEGIKSNINNYKGVMLCTRPNENIAVSKETPFISRVDPKAQLGINPVRKVKAIAQRKRANPILSRHRQWLESFKERMREKRTIQELQAEQDKEKFKRIREKAEVNKSRAQEDAAEYSPNAIRVQDYVQQEQPSPTREEKPKQKKKDQSLKPKWAYTEQQVKDEEEQDVDDLLDFTNNLDYDKYLNDLEVKHMVLALKKRIDEIKHKEDDDWKKKIVDEWNNERQALNTNKVDLNLDARSDTRSVASESKSVASERSQKHIQDLKAKMTAKDKEWETMSTTTKKNAVTMEERIAKHVADEILRNNTEFRHFHSNASVRRILEKEAQRHLEETRGIRAPEIATNKEYFSRKDVTDPNNLPYLHRNPAI